MSDIAPFVAADAGAFTPLVKSIPDFITNLQQAMAFKSGLAAQSAQTQQVQAQTAELAQKQSRAQMFQQDLGAVGNNPNPQAISSLIMKYPEFADQLKSGWDVKDKAAKDADLTQLGEVYSAASAGNWDTAAKAAQARVDADKAAGNADPSDQAMLDQIQAAAQGDPKAQKAVLTTLGTHLAAVTGPDHFASVFGALKGGYTLDAGAARYDDSGNLVAHSPFIKDADGNIRLWNDTSGAPPPATGAQAQGGQDNAVATVLKNEGGYNPNDMNDSPTMRGINWKANAAQLTKMGLTPATFKNMTDDQARQVYQGYWDQSGAQNLPANMQTPFFDVYVRSPRAANAALTASGGDPQRFMQLTNAYFNNLVATNPKAAKYAQAWTNRDKNNLAIATGQASPQVAAPANAAASDAMGQFPIVIPGKSAEDFRVLSDAEVKARALDPEQQYQLNTKTGEISGLGKKSGIGDDVLSQYKIGPDETGPSVLAKLPANVASQVKALAEGRLPMPSSFALAKPYWQTMLQLTSQYDPSFDASSYPARKAAITAFTGMGKGAQVIGSVNRVANHLGLLWNESLKLAGPETGVGPINTALAATGQAFEPQDARAYDTEVGFVAGELGKIAKAGVVTEGEVDRILSNLSRKQSASTRASAIKAAVGIISGAVDPLKDQYNSAFTNGSTRPNIPWVSPRAQQIYSKIGGPDGAAVDLSLTGQGAGSNNAASNSTAPVRVSSPAEAAKLPSGTLFVTPDGRTLRKR